MLRALSLSLAQLSDPAIVGILLRSLAVTLLLFAAAGVAIGWWLTGADPCDWLGLGVCPLDAGASGFGAVLLAAAALWFLFPAVGLAVVSAYMDQVVAAVERRHYPAAAAAARPLGWLRGAMLGLRSSARLLIYNLLALPLYLVLLVTGVGTLLLFVAVNGLAFGRDLGEMVAARHLRGGETRAWLRTTRGRRAVLGALVTALFLVPVVNLLAPVLAAAMATHLFHDTSGGGAPTLQR